jgi:hypothetical protein
VNYSFGVRLLQTPWSAEGGYQVFYQAYVTAMQWVVRLNMRDWFWVLIGCVAFGVFCMRGFGSRNSY